MPVVPSLRSIVIPSLFLLAACKGDEASSEQAAGGIGYLFHHEESGVMVDLPTSWRGRFVVADSITRPVDGLRREMALRYVKADSAPDAETPMMVAYVFDKEAWASLPGDSVRASYGAVMAEDENRALVLRRATATPYAAGTRDAAAYDSLMGAAYRRPLRAVLRAP